MFCFEQTRSWQTYCALPLGSHVKYLQFVESITQYALHLRRPYDLETESISNPVSDTFNDYRRVTVLQLTSHSCEGALKHKEVHGYEPWKIGIARLVAKVFSVALFHPFPAIAISTVCMFALCKKK